MPDPRLPALAPFFRRSLGLLLTFTWLCASATGAEAIVDRSKGIATTVTNWPTASGPCSTTLQACLDGNPRPLQIKIQPGSPVVSGDVAIVGEAHLIGVGNARPLFRNATVLLFMATPGSVHQQLENLVLEDSTIQVQLGSTVAEDLHQATLRLLKIRNQIALPAIRVTMGDRGSTDAVRILDSDITANRSVRIATGDLDDRLLVFIANSMLRQASRNSSLAVEWSDMDDESHLTVTGSRFEGLPGNLGYGLSASASDNAAAVISSVTLERNVFAGLDVAMLIEEGAHLIRASIRHNSVLRCNRGIFLIRDGSASEVGVSNTLFQSGVFAIDSPQASGAGDIVASNRNLFWQISPGIASAANSILSNPQTRGPYDARLVNGSPAIDAADPTFATVTTVNDFDGVNGVRGAGPDIGAFEWTSAVSSVLETSNGNIFGNTAQIPESMLSATLGDVGIFQRVTAGNGAGLPATANKNLGLYQVGSRFDLFTQDLSTFPNAEFRVLRPGTGTYARDIAFIHRAINEPGNPNNNTLFHETIIAGNLFPGTVSNRPMLRPLVVQRWDPPGSTGTYNNHPVGLYFSTDTFRVINSDLANMPHGAGFHVLAPSNQASYSFTAVASSDAPVSAVPLPHRLTNDNPCAHVYLTNYWGNADVGSGIHVPSPLLARYDPQGEAGGTWVAVRGDGQSFSPGTQIQVYIDPEVANRCVEDNPFASSFE